MSLRAKAVVTTNFNGKIYQPKEVVAIQDYFVDSSMDTDSDQFQISIGDPSAQLVETLKRDNEVRVNIFVVGDIEEILHTGFVDTITLSEEGNLVLSGRDMTAPAVDSTHMPGTYFNSKPHMIVEADARELKIASRLSLRKSASPFKKIRTDGSESYWEFWYRVARKRQMWLWAEPDGTIVMDFLNYYDPAVYRFGRPAGPRGTKNGINWIKVERCEISKTTTTRVGDVWAFGENGTGMGLLSFASDPDTAMWLKRPRKIMTLADARYQAQLTNEIWDEIYDSKVGALEIKLLIQNPGRIIRQNRMAEVNLPEYGLTGQWFVVGTRIMGGPQGQFQEVRLREKEFAISRKVPPDPAPIPGPGGTPELPPKAPGDISGVLNVRWAQHFVSAAFEFHGDWPFTLFLAVLLGICDQESTFHNCREGDSSIEWYDARRLPPESNLARQHRERFANDPGNPYNPYGRDAGVGPMQLTTHSYKLDADNYGGRIDEYYGGRWVPEHNIRAAAKAFKGKLAGLIVRQENIWIGVGNYNGSGVDAPYAQSVKRKVEQIYLPMVLGVYEQEKDANRPGRPGADPGGGIFVYPLHIKHQGYPNYPTGGVKAHWDKSTSSQREVWQNWRAVDLAVPYGTKVYAVVDGTISPANREGYSGFGSLNSVDPAMQGLRFHLVSSHSNNAFYYAHCSDISLIKPGQKVVAGQVIAKSGKANGVDHLHFAAELGDVEAMVRNAIDPREYRGPT